MKKTVVLCSLFALVGCGGGSSYVRSDTTLGRVVVYRNGVAYFERYARVEDDTLRLAVPADKVDDFLKSLTVIDAKTGKPAPIAYPTSGQNVDSGTGLIDMNITLQGAAPHDLKLSYVTEAPSWKPSYRIVVEKDNKVNVQAWAIVDNTSGEDWKSVKLGVGSSSALSFRFDLRTVRTVQRETLHSDDLFAAAPPTGGPTHGREIEGAGDAGKDSKQRFVAELSDDSLALSKRDEERAGYDLDGVDDAKEEVMLAGKAASIGGDRSRNKPARKLAPTSGATAPKPAVSYNREPTRDTLNRSGDELVTMAQKLRGTKNQVVIEGYADKSDPDKFASSLDRANRVRDQLIRNGLSPDQVVAVGNGERDGKKGGVRIVEGPPPPPQGAASVEKKPEAGEGAAAGNTPGAEPIGTSHFESKTAMTVARGTSAMVSILSTETEGQVVFFYDRESARGNAAFPFRAIRIKNPTDSVLESGPVTVFGDGKFIGEGLSDPIPARSVAFVPFALDRQIVVDKDEADRDEISKIITVQRGVFTTEVKHTRKTTLTLHNRLDEKATVYIRHSVTAGYELTKAPEARERLGTAHLFRVEVEPNGKAEVVIEEATPLQRTTDIRSTPGMTLVKAYLSSAAAEGPLKTAVTALLAVHQEMGNIEQQISTMREEMQEYRARMDELHAQIVTLRLVKTTGGPLLQHLEKKMQEVSDKLSKATIDLVALQEKLMVARIRFQDGVSELSLEKKDGDAKPADAKPADAKPTDTKPTKPAPVAPKK